MTQQLVLLSSYPRSGNTLVRHVLESVYGTPTYTVYPSEDELLWAGRYASDIDDGLPVAFVKTHELKEYEDYTHKTIYIIRDGRDALLSQAKFTAAFNGSGGTDWSSRLRSLIDDSPTAGDRSPVTNWSEHVRTLWGAADARIRFEDLILDPVREVTGALRHIGVLDLLPKTDVPMPTFNELHARHPAFYRKGTSGQWREDFPVEWLDDFWAKHGDTMEMVGYESNPIPIWAQS